MNDYLVAALFLGNDNLPPKSIKTYQYIVSEKCWENIEFGRLCTGKGEWYRPYHIINSEGYNYRNSKVIFLAWKPFEGSESGLKKLITFEPVQCINFSVEPALSIISESSRLLKEGWSISHDETVTTSSNINSNCCTNTTTSSSTWISNGTSTGDVLKYNSNGNWISTPYTTSDWTMALGNYPTQSEIDEIKKRLDKIENENKKENKKMFESLTKNLKFGRAQDVRMSIYGPAFKGEDGNWYSVDTDGELTDVSDLLFDMDSYCYMMPVSKSAIIEGDFILHNGHWVKVIDYSNGCVMQAVDIFNKQFITPTVTKSPFGFEFYTKLVQLLDFSKMPVSVENPFGMLPMMLMMNNKNDKDILPMLMMMGTQNGGFNFDMSNPMMMYLLMKDNNDALIPLLAMGTFKSADKA